MTTAYIWSTIIILGVGTYIIRLSFLGLIAGKDLPDWVLRHLRYTAVGVLPGLVAPLVLWPDATGGEIDPARLAAACVAFGVGLLTRNVIAAIVLGGGTLFGMIALLGAY